MGLLDKFASLFGHQASAPIFTHSSFRTSSTWIWSKFRAHPGVLAYYECFHEDLKLISAAGIKALRPDHWESGHPEMDPYFKEFIPLLRRGGGIAGFDRSMAFERFFPADGYNGSLSRAEVSYIERLMARGTRLRRKPCLACKRSLGRLRALKQSIGGTHIVLQRSLLPQWRSYREQAFTGNPYFLDTLLRTIALNQREPFMAFLGDFVRAQPGGSADIVNSKLGSDDFFSVFVAFHCYLYFLTMDDTDLVIRTLDLTAPVLSPRRGGIAGKFHGARHRFKRCAGDPPSPQVMSCRTSKKCAGTSRSCAIERGAMRTLPAISI